MRIPLTYISVILLWATTPLAIKWSGEGPGFLFGVSARMAIGTGCILFILILMHQRLAWHRKACLTYLAVALQIYGSMLAVYWAAQFIPSGWISVIFGLTPLMTALLAALFLGERSLTLGKLLAYGLGVSGLAIMFGSALQFGYDAVLGISGVLVSSLLQSISSVWIKCIAAKLPALSQVAGGLLLALPAHLGHSRWPLAYCINTSQLSCDHLSGRNRNYIRLCPLLLFTHASARYASCLNHIDFAATRTDFGS
ncbi:MAG: hypothetical protein CG438_618 [Methylococcaceae bacterium NSP1-1]|nr:MAG: hypothetical protein CG438_618 [Methylococcaceae bacterium NSP1-1]